MYSDIFELKKNDIKELYLQSHHLRYYEIRKLNDNIIACEGKQEDGLR